MKPVKLIMEGFGSYIKRTEIDFTAFGDNALFLITGSTGGGKTTILDAICFALYGKATGGLRSWEQMRSIGADESIPTSVDFTFSLGYKTYRFFRSQSLYRGRRDGAVKIRVENSCYDLSDGEKLLEAGADRSISARAQALLGLDCDQFSRVMILPQGEFRRLLISQSSEKAKLFEKLFDAQQWSKITDCAIKKADEVRDKALSLQSERLAVLSGCGCDSVSRLEEKADAATEKYKQTNQEAERLDKALKTKQAQAERLKKRDELKCAAEKSLISLEQSKHEQEAAITSFAGAEKNTETLERVQNEINRERENARQLDEALNAVAKITQAQRELTQRTAALEKAREQKLALEEQSQKIHKMTADREEYTAALSREIQRIPSEIIKLQTLSEINESYKTLEELKTKLTAAKKEAEAAGKSYDSSLLELEALKESEKIIDAKIRGNMSVFLSSRLESGKPCPVCGSTEHPHPAVLTGEKEQGLVKKQKELLRLIKEKEAHCSELLRIKSEKVAACSQINAQLNEQQKKCDGYNIYYKTWQHDLELQKHTLDELNAKKAKLPTAEKQLAALKAQLEQISKNTGELTKSIIELEASRAQSQERINTLIQLNQNHSEGEKELKLRLDTVRKTILKLEKQERDIQNEYTRAKSRLEAATALMNERRQKLEEYQKQALESEQQCAELASTDTESLLEECRSLEQQLKSKISESGESKKESESLRHSLAQIKKQLEKSEECEKLYSSLSHLANILKGSNPMKVPIKMFVLGMMLDDILMQANKYFAILSEGRYKLEKITQEQGGNSLKGLDIEVFDGCYGGARPVFTLSGGEMFLASLSLAFGLSDVVQGYSGGIRLDSIFIDEGFGTLDSETVETAIKALDKIKSMGRTVGIISHVSQLSEKIANKIIVTSDSFGSHAKTITV